MELEAAPARIEAKSPVAALSWLEANAAAELESFELGLEAAPASADASEFELPPKAEPSGVIGTGAVMVVVGVGTGSPGMPGIGKAALSGTPLEVNGEASAAGVIEVNPGGDMTVATSVDTGIIFPPVTLTH